MIIKILKEGDNYLIPIDTPLKHYNKKVLVNDILVTVGYKVVQIPKPEKIELITETSYIESYNNSNINITIQEYNDQLAILQQNGDYDDGWSFDNLEDEFNYKKFLRDWIPNRKVKTEIETFTEFVFVETITSKYSSIKPVESIVDKAENLLYVYTPDKYELLREACKLTGYTFYTDKDYNLVKNKEKTVSVSDHSGLEYLKINGKYDSSLKNKITSSSRNTYGLCEILMKKHIDEIVTLINHHDSFLSDKKLTTEQKGETIKRLDAIKLKVANIDYKQAGRITYQSALSLINELINDLKC